MTPQDIADLLQLDDCSETDNHDEIHEPESAVEKRIVLLKPVLKRCRELLASDESQLEVVAEKLGDGSRQVVWRLPYGESGILAFFLQQLDRKDATNQLKIHSLRILGNACAYSDQNRELVVAGLNGLEVIIRQLANTNLVPFAIPALYNIMVDYDLAQSLASRLNISHVIIKLLSSSNLPHFMGVILYCALILNFIVSQDNELVTADDKTASTLLSVAITCKDNVEKFTAVSTVALCYLATERFQLELIAKSKVGVFLDVYHHAHVAFNSTQIDDPDLVRSLKGLCQSLLTALAHVSGQDFFRQTNPLESEQVQALLSWLESDVPSLQTAACIALGNVARSDSDATALVRRYAPQEALMSILTNPVITDLQLLHSALSFLKNLAIPAQNKSILRPLLEPSCVPRYFSLDTAPLLQYVAISLTRLLLIDCPENVSKFCQDQVDQDIVAGESDASEKKSKNSVDDLLSLFDRTSAVPTKTEVARTIAVICRVLHSDAADKLSGGDSSASSDAADKFPGGESSASSDAADKLPGGESSASSDAADKLPGSNRSASSDAESRFTAFYVRHPRIDELFALLLEQELWETICSETWFVLALMSRSVSGSRVVATLVQRDRVASRLAEVITGKKETGGNVTKKKEDEEDEKETGGNVAKEKEDEEDEETGDNKDKNGKGHERGQEDEATATELWLQQQPPQKPDLDPRRCRKRVAAAQRENALIMCTGLLRNWSDDFKPLSRAFLQQLLNDGTELVIAYRRNKESE